MSDFSDACFPLSLSRRTANNCGKTAMISCNSVARLSVLG
jgi:hypothetical protein